MHWQQRPIQKSLCCYLLRTVFHYPILPTNFQLEPTFCIGSHWDGNNAKTSALPRRRLPTLVLPFFFVTATGKNADGALDQAATSLLSPPEGTISALTPATPAVTGAYFFLQFFLRASDQASDTASAASCGHAAPASAIAAPAASPK